MSGDTQSPCWKSVLSSRPSHGTRKAFIPGGVRPEDCLLFRLVKNDRHFYCVIDTTRAAEVASGDCALVMIDDESFCLARLEVMDDRNVGLCSDGEMSFFPAEAVTIVGMVDHFESVCGEYIEAGALY